MAFFERFNRWRQDAHIRRLTHRIATYYGRAGAVGPYAAAALELYLRRKIEEFRDFASARYLEDPTLTLADIKQEWLTLVVKPMARSEFMHDNAKALRAAIEAIPHREAFVGAAKLQHQADLLRAVQTARAGAVYRGRTI